VNPNFADDSKWSVVYDQLTTAIFVSRNPDVYNPIPAINLNGFALGFRYLRVTANNQNAKATWRYGGRLDFLVNESNASVEIASKSLGCNRPVIVVAPDFVDTYQIRVSVPYWFDEVALVVEGYIE
jgi:hypothetical protein